MSTTNESTTGHFDNFVVLETKKKFKVMISNIIHFTSWWLLHDLDRRPIGKMIFEKYF